jgi:AmiR/NasT family two-component response regulator
MKRRAFVIHWNAAECEAKVAEIRKLGFEVDSESKDGAEAGRKVKANLPDVIIVHLSRLPSHGRETAEHFAATKAYKHIPIVFVDGAEEKLLKVKEKVPAGIFVTSDKLPEQLCGMFSA